MSYAHEPRQHCSLRHCRQIRIAMPLGMGGGLRIRQIHATCLARMRHPSRPWSRFLRIGDERHDARFYILRS